MLKFLNKKIVFPVFPVVRRISTSKIPNTQAEWTRYIRLGQPKIIDNSGSWSNLTHMTKLEANLIIGDIFKENVKVTSDIIRVKKLLAPLDRSQVPIIRCIGLNYKEHAKETNQKIPPYPILFIKPNTSLQNPFESIIVPDIATNNQVDYEAELAVIIKKECKNVTRDNSLDYVLGYTAANDVSARKWQVSPRIIKNPNSLGIRAIVNNKMLQNSNTQDMIFDVPELISFLSQGVGFIRDPPIFLQDGDK
ncbi:2091_t:CDS:2 [Diversispora eburnea]|uniref:2091_t:CDS:1 n=1 Tax=Diversispora eburnea TaxID=1213867 RepID=A0A9N8VXR3_9GLOM|nr:2091_t:CDS:2 [Diversispora eburnea]